MSKSTTPAPVRKSVGSILLGDVVRLANNRAKGDNAWHTVTKLHAGRDARTGKPATTLWAEDGELGTFLYPVRFEVQPDAATLLAAELTETYPASATQIATALDAVEAKHGLGAPEMPRKVAVRPRVAPTADDTAKSAAHTAETRAYLAKQAAELEADRAATTCPNCDRFFKTAKLLASHLATELTREAAATRTADTKAANEAAKPAKAPKAPKPAGERAPRKPRISDALRRAVGTLTLAPDRSLTRRELHADPMVVKAMENRGWATVDRTGDERGVDLITLTQAGVDANRPS